MARNVISTIPRLPIGGVFIKNAGMEFETGSTSTNNAFVGTESGKWRALIGSGGMTVSYDNVVYNSALGGLQSIKCEVTSNPGNRGFGNLSWGVSHTLADLVSYAVPIKPSTAYTLTFYYKMTGVTGGSITFDTQEHDVDGGARTTYTQTNLGTGTQDWTKGTVTWTSAATSIYMKILSYTDNNITAGTWWIDDITLKETTPSARTTVTPFSATGGDITTSGAYTIHTFTTDGTLACTGGIKGEVLVVGGGGGGGSGGGGGGGGGGVISNTSYNLGGNMNVSIAASVAAATVGNNSVFGTITAYGGGRGGPVDGNGGNGASGGGGGANGSGTTTGGTASQGNIGGGNGGYTAAPYTSGGGGGAGGAGVNASSNVVSGNGGLGTSSTIQDGSTKYYGGGGGGGIYASGPYTPGTGGSGVGGDGKGGTTTGGAGTINRGSGGGGSGSGGTGGAGSSGIVIIRYLTGATRNIASTRNPVV